MTSWRQDFHLFVRFLAIAAVAAALPGWAAPVWAQTATPIPDFSGIWAHLTWPDTEPPLSGPGPVTNKSHREGVSDLYQLIGDHSNPILKPQAAEAVERKGELELAGGPSPTPSNQCWPGGVPFVFYNIGMQMLQQGDRITFLYSNDHEVRHVRMNAAHATPVTPSWYGDSVGHYEGDTLVIDTVGIKVGPFAMVDMYGTPRCTWWSATSCSITRPRRRRPIGASETTAACPPRIRALHPTPTIGAKGCSSNSRSRTKGCSPRPGRRR